MTESMLCGTCVAPGQFELIPAPKPQAAPEGWVLVDIAAAGICGRDYRHPARRDVDLSRD